ncbi:AraC family transcriptional regulator [Carboxylicivirga sp. N1Y90]|uniref:AraC family transcriptional regulator n=1 Tax=Carboxylicivirga fragile TaxID=3417571 RepID=UPI003D3520C7|nr:AraC family transcriptional regulator [Marinilabiliaceae bacterium N1Y90]
MKFENVQIKNEYRHRINKTIDYIDANFSKQFTLDELAAVANFSKFHFHRIFQGVVGETPFNFITRVRLERAANLLKSNVDLPITEVAFRCGYSDASVFSRKFKQQFKQSATQFRTAKENSKISQVNSKLQQADDSLSMYICASTNTIKWKTNMELNKGVEVKTLPERTVVYVRHIGPYKGNEELFKGLWNKLFAWAGPRGLVGNPNMVSMAVYHDDPNITEEMKLRTSICISAPEDTKVDGEVGKMRIEGGQYMVARFEVDATQFAEAWQWVYSSWMPASGYQPDDKPCFEMYNEEPKNGIFTVDICVPVKPL